MPYKIEVTKWKLGSIKNPNFYQIDEISSLLYFRSVGIQ